MKAKVDFYTEVNSFHVPDFVDDDDGNVFTLSSLDVKTLSDLCDEYRRSVFEKANKRDPLLD